MTTIVKCRCVSKQESQNYAPANPIRWSIRLEVPYDQASIFFQLSGGTALELNTVNKNAADMFSVGGDYDLSISPSA